jgi:zinc protease
MRRTLKTLIVAMMLAGCAPTGPEAPRAGSDPFEVAVYDGAFATIQQFTTPGGVSVWLVEEPSIPILSLRMAWKTGTTSDPIGQDGLTDAVTYMMNEGAGDYDTQAFQTRMEELNMSFGCSAARVSTACSASMLTDNLEDSFELIGLAYASPRFDPDPFGRLVRERAVGLETRQTNAGYLASRALVEALYPDHPFARQISEDSLAALTPEAAKAHKDRLMSRDGLLVTAVGAVSPQQLAPLIDAMIAGLPETTERAAPRPVDMASAAPAPILVDLPQPQSLVQFIGPGVTREHADFYPLAVMNYIFGGGGFGTRLMDELRVARGLTYGIYTQVDPDAYLPVLAGGGTTKNESAAEFVDAIADEMTTMAETGATAQELEDALLYLIGSYPLSFDSNAKIAANMMSLRLDDLPVDQFDRRNERISSVTLEDVNRVAATYLDPARYTFVVVGEPEGFTD